MVASSECRGVSSRTPQTRSSEGLDYVPAELVWQTTWEVSSAGAMSVLNSLHVGVSHELRTAPCLEASMISFEVKYNLNCSANMSH